MSDFGPFGRPLFDSAAARALSRVGVVDVGSNSVRLVVFDGAARSPAYFYNEKIMAGLGADMADTGRLSPDGRKRAFAALSRFQILADTMQIAPLSAVATAAIRDAEDGPEFRRLIEDKTGLRLYVIDGEEEARLSAQGVLLGWPGAYGLVCDIGGSSMELAELRDGKVGKCLTSSLGPQRLKNVKGGKKGLARHLKAEVSRLADALGQQSDRLFLVGGSWRAIARIDMTRRGYPLPVLHEYRMTRKHVLATVDLIETCDDLDALRTLNGLSESRMALVPLAAQVLREVVRRFKPHDIAISSYGIREGLLYEQMPDVLRARDPLIESCRYAEANNARIPGFGRRLYRFVWPVFETRRHVDARLVRAACLLHDVAWRAHPDYRHEVGFDEATRTNLGNITHQERVFLGLALFHRYKNNASGARMEHLFDLIGDDLRNEAECLGKAMRFGAMLTVSGEEPIGTLKFQPRKKRLHLRLEKATAPLFGEVAESRLTALASALGAEEVVVKGR